MTPHEAGFTILIVDDDEGHVELVRRNLRRISLTNPIVALPDGTKALDYVFCRGEYEGRNGGQPLILLDINMPGSVNGPEVLRQIKGDKATSNCTIIMLSTTDNPLEVTRCYGLGCSVYITKPVDSLKFIEAIRRLGCFLQIISVALPEEVAAESTAA
jgi:CheY-like chemotaxis protein